MLELKDLTFSVMVGAKRRPILHKISLKVRPGELVVITGPNGSGKSTLAKLIVGIHTPTSGHVFYHGEDITKLSITDRVKLGLAYSFQQPVKFKGLTVRELLQISATGTEALKPDNSIDYEKLLNTVGLSADYLDRDVDDSLSGGELKRLEIASALARKAQLAVFDEPEAGIDIWSFDRLTKVFQNIHKTSPESSTIIISHQKRILELADRIIILKAGSIFAEGKPEQMLKLIETSENPNIKGIEK